MTNRPPQFEMDDSLGTTVHYNGTVGTSPASVPAAPGAVISHVYIKQPLGSPPYTTILYYSFDAGTTWNALTRDAWIMWPLRDSQTQIQIKGSAAGVAYEILMNLEPT